MPTTASADAPDLAAKLDALRVGDLTDDQWERVKAVARHAATAISECDMPDSEENRLRGAAALGALRTSLAALAKEIG